jgi:hypothetical protein
MAKQHVKRAARRRHSEALTGVFIEFQVLEEALKIYLRKQGRSAVEELTLRPLIDRFANRSRDFALAKKLHAFVKPRDHCAHRAYLEAFVTTYPSVAARDAKVKGLLELRAQLLSVQDSLKPHLILVGALVPGR